MALGIYYYDNLPDQVAIHFSFGGNPNSYMSKNVWHIDTAGSHGYCGNRHIQNEKNIAKKKGEAGLT